MGAAQKRCCWSRLLVGFRRTPLSLAPKQEGAEPQPAGQHISRSTKRRRVRPHRHLCSRVQTQEGNEGLSEIACSARLRVGLGVAVVGDPWSPRTRTSPCLGCGLAAAAAATARRNWRRPRELARWVLLLAPGSCGCRWDMSFLQRSNITPQATLQNKHTRLGPASAAGASGLSRVSVPFIVALAHTLLLCFLQRRRVLLRQKSFHQKRVQHLHRQLAHIVIRVLELADEGSGVATLTPPLSPQQEAAATHAAATHAASITSARGRPPHTAALVGKLEDSDKGVRRAAVRALGKLDEADLGLPSPPGPAPPPPPPPPCAPSHQQDASRR